jgi:shikimate dehydrogenase
MSSAVPKACVMGHPVAHSRSPMIHGYWLRTLGIPGSYELKDLTPEAFPDFVTHLAANGYVGGNVTVPHKEAAFRLVDTHGFIANLDDRAPGWDVADGRAVILGAGGAARSAAYALATRGLAVQVVNRTVARAHTLAADFGPRVSGYGFDALARLLPEADLLVNCTSLGMTGKPPLDADIAPLKPSAVVYDVVYVPLETALLAAARARGHRVVDGLGMLLQQAGFGFQKWFGTLPQVTAELRAIIELDIRAKTGK